MRFLRFAFVQAIEHNNVIVVWREQTQHMHYDLLDAESDIADVLIEFFERLHRNTAQELSRQAPHNFSCFQGLKIVIFAEKISNRCICCFFYHELFYHTWREHGLSSPYDTWTKHDRGGIRWLPFFVFLGFKYPARCTLSACLVQRSLVIVSRACVEKARPESEFSPFFVLLQLAGYLVLKQGPGPSKQRALLPLTSSLDWINALLLLRGEGHFVSHSIAKP